MKLTVHLSPQSIKILEAYFIVISNDTEVDLESKPILKDVLDAYIDEKVSEHSKPNSNKDVV